MFGHSVPGGGWDKHFDWQACLPHLSWEEESHSQSKIRVLLPEKGQMDTRKQNNKTANILRQFSVE